MEVTVEQYRKAIKNALSAKLFNVLQMILKLPEREITILELAAVLQTNVQGAHSKIGYIGKIIADYLGIVICHDEENNNGIATHFQIIGDYVAVYPESTRKVPVWKMNDNLRKALKRLKTDEKGISERVAFNIWKILTGAARTGRKISRNEMAQRTNTEQGTVDLALIRISEYCLNYGLPPLVVLVASRGGANSATTAGGDSVTEDINFNKVCAFDWYAHTNPFNPRKEIFTDVEIIKSLVANPELSKEMFAKVKVRGKAQPLFRKALMEVYDSKCALCGFSVEYALEASHIVAWSVSKNEEKLDVRNGILLCATHHKLFDSHLIRINNDFSISVNLNSKTVRKYSDCDKVMIQDLCNRKIILPRRKEHWPRVEYIEKRNKQLESKGCVV